MKTLARNAAIVGITAMSIGVLTSALDPVLRGEESFGLRLLYLVRGEVPPPAKLVIVNIDSDAAKRLGLEAALADNIGVTGWPHELQADLIEALDQAGARLIVFDFFFVDPQSEWADARLASAMTDAGSVILGEELVTDETDPDGNEQSAKISRTWTNLPLPRFTNAALTTAPFSLPTRPFFVNQYRPFVGELSEKPTLPVAAFGASNRDANALLMRHLQTLRPDALEPASAADDAQTMAAIRRLLLAEPKLADALRDALSRDTRDEAQIPLTRTALGLVDLYTDPYSNYINFYGTAETITTIPVDAVLKAGSNADARLHDAVVFVGFSDPARQKQMDYFLSFFSEEDGINVSGVEIAATAFGNLAEGRVLRDLPNAWNLLIVAITGLAFGTSFRARSVAGAVTILVAALTGYLVIAQLEFNLASLWLPVVVPAAIQAPVALVLGLSLRYSSAREQQAALAHGASQYLPRELVTRFMERPKDSEQISELVNGVCLATDIEHYTAYSETMTVNELKASLNRYYDALFSIVDKHDGLVTDIVGDSMIAVWRTSVESIAQPAPVCAALEIEATLTDSGTVFPRTRAGLAAGEFLLGTIGAKGHLEYRAVGDTVNSASRIEELNKRLGTTILSTRSAIPQDTVLYRNIGSFQVPGKAAVLEICEPVATVDSASSSQRELVERFEAAVATFNSGQSTRAMRMFEAILVDFGTDGPSSFYVDYIGSRIAHFGRGEYDPVIRLA